MQSLQPAASAAHGRMQQYRIAIPERAQSRIAGRNGPDFVRVEVPCDMQARTLAPAFEQVEDLRIDRGVADQADFVARSEVAVERGEATVEFADGVAEADEDEGGIVGHRRSLGPVNAHGARHAEPGGVQHKEERGKVCRYLTER